MRMMMKRAGGSTTLRIVIAVLAIGGCPPPGPVLAKDDLPEAKAPGEPANVPYETVKALVDTWRDEVKADKAELDALYSFSDVQATFARALEPLGGDANTRTAQRWAGGSFVAWSWAGDLYDAHHRALMFSHSGVFAKQRHATPGQIEYLRRGMSGYRELHRQLRALMAARLHAAARYVRYLEMAKSESEAIQTMARERMRATADEVRLLGREIRELSRRLAFETLEAGDPKKEYAPESGPIPLPYPGGFIDDDGGEVPLGELKRLHAEDVATLKRMWADVEAGREEFDAQVYLMISSQARALEHEIKERGGTVAESVPKGIPRYDPKKAIAAAEEDNPAGRDAVLPEFPDDAGARAMVDELREAERRFRDKMTEQRESWDFESALKWNGEREQAAQALSDAHRRLALALAGPQTPQEMAKLERVAEVMGELAHDRSVEAKLQTEFDSAKKLLDDYVAVNTVLNQTAGTGNALGDTAMKAGNYRAWWDANNARDRLWEHQGQMNDKGREALRLQDEVLHARLVRGEEGVNRRLREAGHPERFRAYSRRDLLDTDNPHVVELLGAERLRTMRRESELRRRPFRESD